jgi:hypothetical protein
MTERRTSIRRVAVPAAFLGGGLLAGAVLTGTLSASAATSPPAVPGATAAPDDSEPPRSDEEPLTGDVASTVTEAALARYPGATVLRVETDSDGVYEAHLRTADGQRVTVEVGEDFVVTGTETGGPGGPGCGPGGHHGPGDDAAGQDDATSGSPSSTDT